MTAPLPPPPGKGAEPGVTILVIEDDRGLAELIREDFEARGWACVLCPTGRDAVAWLEGHTASLALLDYSLPDMNGAALLDLVTLPPFIVTTGAGDERIAVAMMKRGALDYLVKDGLFLETLPGAVARALGHLGTERRLADAEASLRVAEESLRQAQKMESLGLMAGGIAHDFNNLFQSLQGNLERARDAAAAGPSVGFLDKALGILAKASFLTHRMLDFSGKGFRDPELLDLNALVNAGLASLADLPGAEIQFQPAPELPPIEGDGGQLVRVLTGLVLNAREAQGASGTVQVATRLCRPGAEIAQGVWIHPAPPGPDLVCLSIRDGGVGMTPEVLERAFDPFFTTHPTGRGLGLSAALGILRGHHAGLWVSTEPGKGTTFRIFLAPAHPQARTLPLRTPGPDPAPASAAGRRTILLADDDRDLRETLADFLGETLGYPVLQAQDGQEALEIYQRDQGSIGVVLMDATMPRMTGAEAFKAILALDPAAKGILCSGFSEETGTQVARECGFMAFLKKPFPLKSLEDSLARALGDR